MVLLQSIVTIPLFAFFLATLGAADGGPAISIDGKPLVWGIGWTNPESVESIEPCKTYHIFGIVNFLGIGCSIDICSDESCDTILKNIVYSKDGTGCWQLHFNSPSASSAAPAVTPTARPTHAFSFSSSKEIQQLKKQAGKGVVVRVGSLKGQGDEFGFTKSSLKVENTDVASC
ncbi:hypothetical protein T439DRAFT_383710 [Meredithblackwellia eburnea MCA 4105]